MKGLAKLGLLLVLSVSLPVLAIAEEATTSSKAGQVMNNAPSSSSKSVSKKASPATDAAAQAEKELQMHDFDAGDYGHDCPHQRNNAMIAS